MSDLRVICNELKALIGQQETPELCKKVETALNSKWTGVQVCAARVLASWRSRYSIELLKAWGEKWYGRDRFNYFAMQLIVSDILADCIEPQDADWVIDTYLNIAYETYGWSAMGKCIQKLRFSAVQDRLNRECVSEDPFRRMATLHFLFRLAKPTTVQEMIKKFLADPDPEIQNTAKWYLEYTELNW